MNQNMLTLVILEYTSPSVYVYHISEDTDIQEFLRKEGFSESQINWIVAPNIELYNDRNEL